MKRTATILLLTFFVISCNSSQKMLERGQYDRAIDRATEKLMKKPSNDKELRVLKEAYELANTFDLEQIELLELEGRPESSVEIFFLYSQLAERQNKVRRLPAQVRNQFEFVNYNQLLVETRSNAVSASYQRGLELLNRGDKASAREAYAEFSQVEALFPGYEDVRLQMREAEHQGRNTALLVVENNSGNIIPDFFDEELRKVALRDISTRWIHFDTHDTGEIDYDYLLMLNIQQIDFSPETIDRETYSVSEEIQDGMKYDVDRNGNVRKDSLGNDIRVPNMITVEAEVSEVMQHKAAVVGGSLDIYELATDQLIRTDNLGVEAVFQHKFATHRGDIRALSDSTRRLTRLRQVPFPSNEQILLDASHLLKERAKVVVRRNRHLLESV
ncbi:MAG: hypothetical protein ACNA78_09435 [Balneolaceae bacterium]